MNYTHPINETDDEQAREDEYRQQLWQESPDGVLFACTGRKCSTCDECALYGDDYCGFCAERENARCLAVGLRVAENFRVLHTMTSHNAH